MSRGPVTSNTVWWQENHTSVRQLNQRMILFGTPLYKRETNLPVGQDSRNSSFEGRSVLPLTSKQKKLQDHCPRRIQLYRKKNWVRVGLRKSVHRFREIFQRNRQYIRQPRQS